MRNPNFEIVEAESSDECLVIRDVGPWDKHPTVTNNPESVVELLISGGVLQTGQRLEYYDSEGRRDQLLVKDGKFAGFAPPREESR